MENRIMARLDVKSLYTNIPVTKCLNILKNHLIKPKDKLPLSLHKIIQLRKLNFNP